MSLITPQRKVDRQAVTIKLEVPVLDAWRHYAEFIASSQEYVANKALRFLFAQDEEFIAWRLGQYPEARLDDNTDKSPPITSARRSARRRRASPPQDTDKE